MPIRTVLALAVAAGIAAPALAQSYEFESTALAGLVGSVDFSVATTGSLRGDWDASTNPAGTRTKPGLFGAFGPTENVAVPVNLGLGLGGGINAPSQFTFGLDVNTGAGSVLIDSFAANFLANGPLSLPASVSLAFDTFRTANPDSLYLGVPLDVPFGDLSLNALTATQVGPAAPGLISPAGGGTYDLTMVIPVVLNIQLEAIGGQMFDLGPIPFALPVDGQLQVSGQTASLAASASLNLDETFDAGVALPQFPLGLPTILPPGDTANLLFDLMLGEIGANIDATINLDAVGIVPAPSTAFALMAGGLAAARRRR